MFIKHLAKFAALAMAVSLWSCSDDLPENGPDVEEGQGDFFATVTLAFPSSSGSRSTTETPTTPNVPAQSSDGFEVGKNSENTISSVLVVLAAQDANGKWVWIDQATTIPENVAPGSGQTNNMNQYTLRFRSDLIIQATQPGQGGAAPLIKPNSGTGESEGGTPLYIFVYGNPPAEFAANMTGDLFDPLGATNIRENLNIAVKSTDDQLKEMPIRNGISKRNEFFMTNALLSSYRFTLGPGEATIADQLVKYNKPANALPLGTVYVERAACRFDYQDPSYQIVNEEGQTVNVGDATNGFSVLYNQQPYAYIKLDGMALFNESKKFYILPRVTDKGVNPPTTPNNLANLNVDICGIEKYSTTDPSISNWVVSPNWNTTAGYNGDNNQTAVSQLFNYPTAGPDQTEQAVQPRSFTYTALPLASGFPEDNHASTDPNPTWPYEGTNYKIWRYTTENTIPGINQQQNGISTGIYFRAHLSSYSGTGASPVAAKIAAAMANGEPIYAYSDNLDQRQNNTADIHLMLGSAQEVWAYARTNQATDVAKGFLMGCKYGLFEVYKNQNYTDKVQATDNPTIIFPANDADGNPVTYYVKTKGSAPTSDALRNSPDNFWALTNSKVIEDEVELPSIDDEGNATTVTRALYLKDLGFYAYYATNTGTTAPSWTYYVYYPYYNRHNNNGDNTKMGQMEFATVRNNVYKLQVSNITRIGLPGDVPPDPGTPDESQDVYIQLNVKVLDWVVRLNNGIVF